MSNDSKDDKPPVFYSWRGWYLFLLIVLLLQIILYYWLTLKYS